MSDQKKDKAKIKDITQDKELDEKEMEKVSGGVYIKKTFSTKDDCGGNCMGTVGTATGKEIDV